MISAISPASGDNTASAAGGVSRQDASDFSDLLSSAQQGGSTSLDEIFQRAADTYNVPVNLLKAVAKTESNFRSDAVSSCGAQGIMQLMPSTAKSLGVTDSFDPEQNIMGGAKYLGSLLAEFGDESMAVAGYNAGGGAVRKYGGVPPYAETQNYVQKVMGYAGEDLTAGNAAVSSAGGYDSSSSSALSDLGGFSFSTEDYQGFLQLFAESLEQNALNQEADMVKSSAIL